MKAGDYHSPFFLSFEEDSIRKSPDAGTSSPAMDDGKLPWVVRDCFNGIIDGSGETIAKFRANVVIPSPRLEQISVGSGRPDNRDFHGFLSRRALICSHGITSDGFRSW
jgi:hypothetical protein